MMLFRFLLSLVIIEPSIFSIGLVEIEDSWERSATSDPSVSPAWTYSVSLANIMKEPTAVLGHGGTINTIILAPEFWHTLYGTYSTWYQEGWNMNVFR